MKRLLCSIMTVILLLSALVPCYAHDREGHNLFLRETLFGQNGLILSEKGKKALTALEYASYLALDQYNGKGADELVYLKTDYKVPGIPDSIESFDFSGNQYHRTYTHRGWNYVYPIDKANWKVRKNILLATTEKVFDVSPLSGKMLWHDFGYDKKCESFAALIYYVHVLGDHEARKSYKVTNVMMPLAQATYSPTNLDIISELKLHLQVIFADQKNTHKYKGLMRELGYIEEDARKLAATTGGINSDEKFEVFHNQVTSLLALLKEYVPRMLKEEAFFTDVFY